jgi:hypothetical protein
MADYTAEIAAIKAAIASGATKVDYKDYSATFDSFDKMLARLAWLERQQTGGSSAYVASVASFSRGDG